MEKIEKYKDKLGRTITVTHDSYNVRIKIDDKKVEEIITKNTFYQRMERGKWELIANGNKKT